MSGLQSIGSSIGKGIAKATNAKPAQWLGKQFEKDPEKALAMATVTSIILKDGIGCAMYVTQSLHNDKIPEKKRKFVAALDLTNGVLMIGAQIAMFFAMRKYSGPIFEKLFKKSFNPVSKANTISRMRMQDAEKGTVGNKIKYDKAYEGVKKDALDLFKFVADIAAATIIGKRVVVPLIATPLAKKVEKRMDSKHGNEQDKKDVQEPKTQEQQPAKLDITSTGNSAVNTNLLAKFNK
jgi:hypothetical protein